MTLREQFESLKQNGYICDADNLPPRQWGDGKMHEKVDGDWRIVGSDESSNEKKDQRGVRIEKVSRLSNIDDKEFSTPTRSFLLPPVSKKFTDAINKDCKGVLLSKNTLERMIKEHPEMKDGTTRRNILNNALNNFDEVLCCRPNKKPNYYTLVKNGKHYDMSVIDTDKNKEYFEVVDWRKIDEEAYQNMLKKMEREDGQFLITDERISTGQQTFLLFRSTNNIAHDHAEVKSLRDIYNRIKGL